MSKKDEALKLALEALKQIDEAMPFPVAKLAQKVIREALAEQVSKDKEQAKTDAFIKQLDQALAEQPAQQQEPLIGETNVELGFYSNDASNGQQRELVGKVEMGQLVGNRSHESASNPDAKREIAVITGVDEYGPMLNWYTHWVNFRIGTKLYTSPPAQRKPLPASDIVTMYDECPMGDSDMIVFARAIEAKLKEKNA